MDVLWTRGRTVGRGSYATVSLAFSRCSGDVFAVKSACLSQSDSLQKEGKVLSSLTCPRIVGYKGFDVSRENNELFYNLHLEYVPGGTLYDAIRKNGNRVDESLIVYYTRQIVEGLIFLHSRGIAHCDIKARNILLGETGVKIADFGCAKWVDPTRNELGPIGGTPMFMAPEVARGEEQGYSGDIWALGCTIIEMATGNPPWKNVSDPAAALYRIGYSGEAPEIPSYLSEQAKDFLAKCFRSDPRERWTAAELLKHPFLGEFNSLSFSKVQDSNTVSPTSVLDQGFWNSVQEESGNSGSARHLNSPADRVIRLSVFSEEPIWESDEDWNTIRQSCRDEEILIPDGTEEGDEMMCCSVSDCIDSGMEEVGSSMGFGGADFWQLPDSKFDIKSDRDYLGACKYVGNSVALSSNLNPERKVLRLLLPSISSVL